MERFNLLLRPIAIAEAAADIWPTSDNINDSDNEFDDIEEILDYMAIWKHQKIDLARQA